VGPRRALAACVIALAACGGAPPPVSPGPPPAPTVVASAPPPPALSLLDVRAEAPPAEPAAATSGPVPAYPGRFERVPLPAGVAQILAVRGRDARDVWMLAKGGAVLHWDGTRVTSKGTPRCFTDSCCGRLFDCKRAPSKCTPKAVAKCELGRRDCAWQVDFTMLSVTRDAVVVTGMIDTGGMRAAEVEARLARDGRWSCEQDPDDLIRPGVETAAAGDATITLETPAYMVNIIGTGSLVWNGRRLPLPDEVRRATDLRLAASSDDVWLYNTAGSVWRNNGIGWEPRPTGLDGIVRAWAGDPGSIWILGGVPDEDGDSGDLIRWDTGAGAWRRFPAPQDFRASRALVNGPRDAWLLGKRGFHHLDGRALRRADPPVAFADAWLGPKGDLWVVGPRVPAGAEGAKQTETKPGVAYRMVAP
jgi:hypothetical protein